MKICSREQVKRLYKANVALPKRKNYLNIVTVLLQ